MVWIHSKGRGGGCLGVGSGDGAGFVDTLPSKVERLITKLF